MNREPLAMIVISAPPSAPVVRPPPAPDAIQAERKRLADQKRARKAARAAGGRVVD